MESYCNIYLVGNRKYNRKCFNSDALKLYKDCEHRTFVRLCDRRLGMIFTWCKDSKIIQTIRKFSNKDAGIVTRRKGVDMVEVISPHDKIKYKEKN